MEITTKGVQGSMQAQSGPQLEPRTSHPHFVVGLSLPWPAVTLGGTANAQGAPSTMMLETPPPPPPHHCSSKCRCIEG